MSIASPFDGARQAARSAAAAAGSARPAMAAFTLASALFCFGLGAQAVHGSVTTGVELATGAGAALIAAVLALCVNKPRASQTITLALVAALAVLVVTQNRATLAALAATANHFIVSWDALTQGYVLPFTAGATLSGSDALVMALVFALLCPLVLRALASLMRAPITFGTTVVLVLAGIFAGIATPWSVALTLGGGLVVATMQARRSRRNRSTALTVTTESASMRAAIGLTPVLLIACALALAAGFALASTQASAVNTTALRTQAMDAIDEFRFGTDTLPEGDFTKAHAVHVAADQAESRLEVAFDSANSVEQAYFRGFTGADYTGRGFAQPTYEAYAGQWNGLFSWAEGLGFTPALQNAEYAQVNEQVTGTVYGDAQLTITATGANRRYGYAPYQALYASEEVPLLDLYLLPEGLFGLSATNVTAKVGSQANELFSPGDWVSAANAPTAEADQFLEAERAYRSFVQDTYLTLDDDLRAQMVETFFTGDGWDDPTPDLFSATTRIRSILESRYRYAATPEPYRPSTDGDYLTWFLDTAQEGNSVAFAAAATCAFRAAGIPARYVEGYFLNSANSQALREAGAAEATLTEREAHAWTEVYVDGAGWTPVEVTPGFYSKEYLPEQTIEISREVAGDGSDTGLSGSTEQHWDDWIPEPLRPFAWIGLVLLAVLVVMTLFGLLETQRVVRLRLREREFRRALEGPRGLAAGEKALFARGNSTVSTLLFARLSQVMRYARAIPFDPEQPALAADAVAAAVPDVRREEYLRAVELLQRERFGAQPLNSHEVRLVQDITARIEAQTWRGASLPQRFPMRYLALLNLPL